MKGCVSVQYRGPQGTRRVVTWMMVPALLLALVITVHAAAAEEPQGVWSPNLATGRDPVALIAIAGGLAVITEGPTEHATEGLREGLRIRLDEEEDARRARGETDEGAPEKALKEMVEKLAELGVLAIYRRASTGRYWPEVEVMLYEAADEENYIPARTSEELRFGGTPTAVVYLDERQSVLVATDQCVFELKWKEIEVAAGDRPAGTTAADWGADTKQQVPVLRLYPEGELFPSGIRSMAVGDLTGDNKDELAVVSNRRLTVYKVREAGIERWVKWDIGIGQSEWVAGQWVLVNEEKDYEEGLGFDWDNVVIADVDGDGASDLLLSNSSIREEVVAGEIRRFVEDKVQIIWSERMGFSWPTRIPAGDANVGRQPRSVAAGDLTGNGHQDVVVASGDRLVLLEGAGFRQFGSPVILEMDFPGSDDQPAAKLLIVDLDGDGRDDLAIANPATGDVYVYWGPFARGNPEGRTRLPGLAQPVDLIAVDLDRDGLLDLIALDRTQNELVLLIHQDGREFTRLPNPRFGHGASKLAYGEAASLTDTSLAIASPVLRSPPGLLRKELGFMEEAFFSRVADALEEKVVLTHDELRALYGFEYLESESWGPPGAPTPYGEETRLSNVYYRHNEGEQPNVSIVVLRGGAREGVQGGDPDGSFSFLLETDARTGVVSAKSWDTRAVCPFHVALANLTGARMPEVAAVLGTRILEAAISPLPHELPRAPAIEPRSLRLPGEAGRNLGALAFFDSSEDGAHDMIVTANYSTGDVYVTYVERDGANAVARDSSWYRNRGVNPVDIAVADLDGDGLTDIAVANAGSDDVMVYWGREDGTFSTGPRIPVGRRPVAIASFRDRHGEDAPHGGAVLAVANLGSDDVHILAFAEDRSLAHGQPVRVNLGPQGGKGPISIAAGRSLDWLVGEAEDVFTDLAVACHASDNVLILRGDEHGGFSVHLVPNDAPVHNIIGTPLDQRDGHGPTSIVVGDFDGDGVDDLALSVMFPHGRLQLPREDMLTLAQREYLRTLWQDVFIYYSGGEGVSTTPRPGEAPRATNRTVLDVVETGVAGTGASQLGIIVADDVEEVRGGDTYAGLQLHMYLGTYGRGGLSLDGSRLIYEREPNVLAGEQGLLPLVAAADVSRDGRTDLLVLEPADGQLWVLWGPEFAEATGPYTIDDISNPPRVLLAWPAQNSTYTLVADRLFSGDNYARDGPGPARDLALAGGSPVKAAVCLDESGWMLAVLVRAVEGAHELRLFREESLNDEHPVEPVWRAELQGMATDMVWVPASELDQAPRLLVLMSNPDRVTLFGGEDGVEQASMSISAVAVGLAVDGDCLGVLAATSAGELVLLCEIGGGQWQQYALGVPPVMRGVDTLRMLDLNGSTHPDVVVFRQGGTNVDVLYNWTTGPDNILDLASQCGKHRARVFQRVVDLRIPSWCGPRVGPAEPPNGEPPPEWATLDVRVEGTGAVSIDGTVAEQARVTKGTAVQLVVLPEPGWEFDTWLGVDEDPTEPSISIHVVADLAITAVFREETPDVLACTAIQLDRTSWGVVEGDVELLPAIAREDVYLKALVDESGGRVVFLRATQDLEEQLQIKHALSVESAVLESTWLTDEAGTWWAALLGSRVMLVDALRSAQGEASQIQLPLPARAIAAGDFLGRGTKQLAVAYADSQRLDVLARNEAGDFSVSTFELPFPGGSLGAADVTGDGRAELVAVTSEGDMACVAIFSGLMDVTAETRLINLEKLLPGATMLVGDLTADGRHDVMLVGMDRETDRTWFTTLLSGGDGTLDATSMTGSSWGGTRGAVLADYTGDGLLDLAFIDVYSGLVLLYANLGDGVLATSEPLALDIAAEPISLASFDLNGDGYEDLLVIANDANPYVLWGEAIRAMASLPYAPGRSIAGERVGW